jgi:uncharacterized protein (TIGR02421 family)
VSSFSSDKKLIIEISNRISEAAQGVRILRSIAWSHHIQLEFFKNRMQKLPQVSYPPYDPKPVLTQLKEIRSLIKQIDLGADWLTRITTAIENSTLMIASRGKKDFHTYSKRLYGSPNQLLQNGTCRTIDLARHLQNMFHQVNAIDLGAAPEACVLASTLADRMEMAVKEMFGPHAPEVVLDPSLASNALAGRRRIAIRPGACFTDQDVEQLIEHEAYVHVSTSINGHLQPHLKILGEAHAGTTSTQEGLAVFAEYITGTIDLDRLRRLSDRVIAINMAIDGADFIEVYRYYYEQTNSQEQSFQNAKRVFRGGVISGGAPFTKDLVYLEGLTDIHNLLRVAMLKGKFDYLDLLFVGKLSIDDLPTLKQLQELGLIEKARFVPPWIKDKRNLLAYLSYSSFLNQASLPEANGFYESILND